MEFVLIDCFSVPTEWDYDRYAISEKKRETEKYFSGPNLGFIDKPTTLVDMHGIIFLWYLPGLLVPGRVVCSAPVISPLLLLTFWPGTVQ
jgi:hypothetical protein